MNVKQSEEMKRLICALYYLKCDVYNYKVKRFVDNFVTRDLADVTEQTYFADWDLNINNQFIIKDHHLTKEFLNAYRKFKNHDTLYDYYSDIVADRWTIEKFIVKSIMYINNFYEDFDNIEIKTEIYRYVTQGIIVDSSNIQNIKIEKVQVDSPKHIIFKEHYSDVFDGGTQSSFYSAFTGSYKFILSQVALDKIKTYLSDENKCPKVLREARKEIFEHKDKLALYDKKRYTKSIFIVPLSTKACIINGVLIAVKGKVRIEDDSELIVTHSYDSLNNPNFKSYSKFLVKEDNSVHQFNGYTFIQDFSKTWDCENV